MTQVERRLRQSETRARAETGNEQQELQVLEIVETDDDELGKHNGNGVPDRRDDSGLLRLGFGGGCDRGPGDGDGHDGGDGDDDDVGADDDPRLRKANETQQLLDLVAELNVEFFIDADAVHATVSVERAGQVRNEHLALRGDRFALWLRGAYYKAYGAPASGTAIRQAINLLDARCQFEDCPHAELRVRIAEHDDALFVDLHDDEARAVEITKSGWSVITNPPVKFVRSGNLLPQCLPQRGGSIDELRPFINVAGDDDWTLLVAWLIGALHPHGPYPLLSLTGEQGAAKSTIARVARCLVDPAAVPIAAPPGGVRDLCIAARHAHVLAYDNLSGISGTLSNALCRLATGGGFATRRLYTDSDEVAFRATRPVILNGISDPATRGDLLDRCVCVTVPRIADEHREAESDFWRRFEHAKPRILGALFDAIVVAKRTLPQIRIDKLPRMADFARWVTAAESGLGWHSGTFLAAYRRNREHVAVDVVQRSLPAMAFVRLAKSKRYWKGSATSLLRELASDRWSDARIRRAKDWPRTPQELGILLTRLAPDLRRLDIAVDSGRKNQQRWWELRYGADDHAA